MKRLPILAICMFFCLFVRAAQTMLTIHSKDGSTFSYNLADKPTVTYNGDTLVLTTDKVSVEYALSNLASITFTDSETAVESVAMTGLDKDEAVRVFSVSGSLVKTLEQEEASENISFSTRELPAGIYIIKQGSTTYKIIKQ